LVTKTGTNNWHGSGEWYNQNRNYNSLDNLTKGAILNGSLPGQPAFDNNRFGGTIGGPVIKNKLFVFGPTSIRPSMARARPPLSPRPQRRQ